MDRYEQDEEHLTRFILNAELKEEATVSVPTDMIKRYMLQHENAIAKLNVFIEDLEDEIEELKWMRKELED